MSFLWRRNNNVTEDAPWPADVVTKADDESPRLVRKLHTNNNGSSSSQSTAPTTGATPLVINNNNNRTIRNNHPKPLMEWKEAHRQTCWQKNVLAASPAVVAEHIAATHRLADPSASSSSDGSASSWMVWNSSDSDSDSRGQQQKFQQALLAKVQECSGGRLSIRNSSSSNNNDWTTTPRKILSVVASPIALAASLASSYWEEKSDYDHLGVLEQAPQAPPPPTERHDTTVPTNELAPPHPPSLPRDALVLHVPLVAQCLDHLQKLLQQQQQHHPDLERRAVLIPSLSQWILQNADTSTTTTNNDTPIMAQFIANLPAAHLDLLVDCLAYNHHDPTSSSSSAAARRVTLQKVPHRPNLYALVMVVVSSHSADTTTTNTTTALEVALTLYDLQCRREETERQLQRYRDRAAEATQQALQAQRRRQFTTAKLQMQRRKLLLQQLQHGEQIVWNLERTQQAVEAAVHQQSTVRALQSAAAVLKSLRLGGNIDAASSNGNEEEDSMTTTTRLIMDDLAEEMAHLQVVQQEDAVLDSCPVDDDDDELLQELEALVLQQESASSHPPPPSAAAAAVVASSNNTAVQPPQAPLPLRNNAPLSPVSIYNATTPTVESSSSSLANNNNNNNNNKHRSSNSSGKDKKKILVGSSPY